MTPGITGASDPEVSVQRVPAAAAAKDLTPLVSLYGAAFAGPPWQVTPVEAAARREVMARQLQRAGAEAVLARDHQDIVGAAWGWGEGATLPDDDLHRQVRAVMGPDRVRRHVEPPAVTVVELMVAPTHQRRGLGRRLLEQLVADRPAWLLTHPAGSATTLYRSAGWTEAGRVRTASGVILLIMVGPGA